MSGSHWQNVLRRARSALETGLYSLAPFPTVPWPDLPTQGWVIGEDGRPVPVATPMDGGPCVLPGHEQEREIRR